DKYKGDPYGMIVVPTGASFDDLITLKNDKEIGDKINKIIAALAEENDLKGVIDVADFNDEDKLGKGKEMVDRLTKLVGIFQGLDLSDNRADGDDLLGDAYEYLMRHFATESGKSKGQFYTPSEVSQILAKVVGITKDTPQDATVYDPTCGSGSLLLKASDEAPRGLSIFGQEMDNATSALARMNMILHNNATAKIWKGNTLADPQWKDAADKLKTFDFSVANPPFSNKNWTSGLNPKDDLFKRFVWGTPPEKNGDYTFLLHILTSLKSTGKGAVILPHGVLFRGNAESDIRENLIKQGYIKGIIGLPANLFYGTGIPACIIVIDKEHAQKAVAALDDNGDGKMQGRSIFMIDASKGFIKDGNKNRLRSQDIHKIVDVFNKGLELERFSRLVSVDEIAKNDYNLNIPRYIDSSEPEDLHDLSAHLQGGIPNKDIDALEHFWQVFPNMRAILFGEKKGQAAREGYSHGLVEASKVKSSILAHHEFKDFSNRSLLPFSAWAKQVQLSEIKQGDSPKELIHEISEQLLTGYANSELLSKYDIYQILMDYWADTLQDDVYVLVQDDWIAGKVLRELVAVKGEKLKETPDLVIAKKKYKVELIPPSLIVARYFDDKQTAIDELQAKQDAVTQALESYLEEQGAEEGLLVEAINDKDKITKASVAARTKLATDSEELAALKQATKLFNADATAKKAVKTAQEALDLAVFGQYPKLSIEEIKTLIVDDKWLATLQANIVAEIERVTQQMANRVKQLEERYSAPLPTLTNSVDELSDKVAGHLKAMGLEWAL
ncbi:type I restriction-modification system subunit M, partial [Vibrio sp.]|uniref:type I restriction-modification system subunit M n=1 Tax=Vibrio sp. TaxID=678 RepID=UPI00378AE84B